MEAIKKGGRLAAFSRRLVSPVEFYAKRTLSFKRAELGIATRIEWGSNNRFDKLIIRQIPTEDGQCRGIVKERKPSLHIQQEP
jgi:hypothetical protein